MNYLFFILLLSSSLAWPRENCPLPDLSGVAPFAEEVNEITYPEELIEVEKIDYPRNRNASFCTRPTEMVDTVVLHHSETSTTTTAMDINRYHLNRGTPSDPWYMIAYGYVINSPYAGLKVPTPKVSEGRPMDIVSASQGSSAYVEMDKVQQSIWESNGVVCGKEGEEFKVNKDLIKNGKIKANVTTVGIVINGNYSPYSSKYNPSGYAKSSPRNPTHATQVMVAKLICQLQKQYPRLKYIKWHNYYHPTLCPGNIKNFIGNIKTLAKEYQCEFQ